MSDKSSPAPSSQTGQPAPAQPAADAWILPEKHREQLAKLFESLVNPVNIHLFTRPGPSDPVGEFAVSFCRDLSRLSDKIILHREELGAQEARTQGVDFSPTLLLEPQRYSIRYLGAPLAEEGRSFIETILMISLRDSGLSKESRELLSVLDSGRLIKVFVSPTCPYCPSQVLNAFRAAVERPKLIEAWCVDISQARELAELHGVSSVPHTVINDQLTMMGLEPEQRFVAELATLRDAASLSATLRRRPGETSQADVVILGAGPAGLTAGIYAGRAGLKAVILEKNVLGGQVSLTPVVENYPGFSKIAGVALMDVTAAQARRYCEIVNEEPVAYEAGPAGLTVKTATLEIRARALLIATGATWKKLDVPGESEFFGHGVNYCATCDGYLYKGRAVAVVGGGNTALTDALYLKNLGVSVTVIHRRDRFRAEQYLQDSVARENIPLVMQAQVEAIVGDKAVKAVRVKESKTGKSREIVVDGVFVAIGETANTEPALALGCELTAGGDIKVDEGMRTTIPRVYAAGDVTGGGGTRQIVTAVGQGAVAAMSIFEDLSREKK
ncbi:MAG: FAD-dependent oxidoreductase [Desulfovibrionaceae bacterium]|nr:FAD-dependent oxidoreductase [Desulfovibrionaceae bacterium]